MSSTFLFLLQLHSTPNQIRSLVYSYTLLRNLLFNISTFICLNNMSGTGNLLTFKFDVWVIANLPGGVERDRILYALK